MDPLPTLLKALLWFRKSVYFRFFYLGVLSLLVAALTWYGLYYLGCLSIPLSAIIMFALPYWLKERRTKHFALNGAVVFVAATLLFTALLAQTLYGNDPVEVRVVGPGGAVLENATVTPGRGPPGAMYTFTANLTVPGTANVSDYAVYLNLTVVGTEAAAQNMTPVDTGDWNLANGKEYTITVPADDHIYFFWFFVTVRNGTSPSSFESDWQFGPITAGYGAFYGLSFQFGIQYVFLPISLYFIILMLYWWTGRARVERQRLGMTPEAGTDTGFMCTNCGADVPAAATKCPKCGALFEESPSGSPARKGAASEKIPSKDGAPEEAADENP